MSECKVILITELENGFEIQGESGPPQIFCDLCSWLTGLTDDDWRIVACLPLAYVDRGGIQNLLKWRLILTGPEKYR